MIPIVRPARYCINTLGSLISPKVRDQKLLFRSHWNAPPTIRFRDSHGVDALHLNSLFRCVQSWDWTACADRIWISSNQYP